MLKGADAFNCGTDRFGTMREVLEHLCRHAGTGSNVKSLLMWPMVAAMNLSSGLGISPLGAYHASMYGRSFYFDIRKVRTKLGWSPRYSNNEMFVEKLRMVSRKPYCRFGRDRRRQSPPLRSEARCPKDVALVPIVEDRRLEDHSGLHTSLYLQR